MNKKFSGLFILMFVFLTLFIGCSSGNFKVAVDGDKVNVEGAGAKVAVDGDKVNVEGSGAKVAVDGDKVNVEKKSVDELDSNLNEDLLDDDDDDVEIGDLI